MILSDRFKRLKAPESERTVVQLTQGEGFHYPLYYFIPTITKNGRYIIFHKALNGNVQLHRLDLTTGETIPMTHAQAKNTHWYPWCVDKGMGVLDHRSVLNTQRNTIVFFDGNDVYETDVETLCTRLLFSLPDDRLAIGQNCITPDGRWFVHIHHDKKIFEEKIMKMGYAEGRCLSRHTALCAYNFETGEYRDILFISSPIHHVLPYNNEYFVFCHPVTENGMLLTSLEGGWYTHIRTQDAGNGRVCHFVATRRGLMYEVLSSWDARVYAGIYNPFSHMRYEFVLPDYFGYTHTGADDQGRLWFYENEKKNGDRIITHDMYFLIRHAPSNGDQWLRLIGDWPTFGGGQSAHFHPRVMPGRDWILFTAGDIQDGKSNQLYLLDISDLEDTRGIPSVSPP